MNCIDAQPFTVGRFYRVPCIQAVTTYGPFKTGEWVPVLLPAHDDLEIIRFEHEHYHLDDRFLSENQLRKARGGVSRDDGYYDAGVWGYAVLRGRVHNLFAQTVVLRRRKCRRRLRPEPFPYEDVRWSEALEDAYSDKVAANGRCPHRGLLLTECEPHCGVVTCPGHALNFDVVTGKLIRARDLPRRIFQ